MSDATVGIALPQGLRRTVITVCTMAATTMQALDQTIANVAVPYMQGSLSASLDQVNWVLTSYIVAAAIMTAPIGFMANRFGRKRLYVIVIAGFTAASFLCGVSQTIEQLVLFRILQGACGAALVPLSQVIILDAYTLEERPRIMAIWGGVTMLGPIMGPTLGGWLTDAYSWHWIFLINVPIGIVTVFMILLFMEETSPRRELAFDFFGFLALSTGIGSLQLMLDRGEQLGWFTSTEIIIELIIAIGGFYVFFAHSVTTANRFINFEVFRDRSFLGGCLSMAILGIALLGTMALASPFLQNVLGFPPMTAGALLASRGAGTLIAMLFISRLLRLIEPRYLMQVGFSIIAFSVYLMSTFTDMTSPATIATVTILQGFGLGLVFVPRNIIAFQTLAPHLRTEATVMMIFFRNVGGSIGISVLIANLSDKIRLNYAQLAEFLTPFNDAVKMPDVAAAMDLSTDVGRALADQLLTHQASILAYAIDFRLLTLIILCALPLAMVLDTTRGARRAGH